MSKNNMKSNLIYAFAAQFVTLVVSAITSIGGAILFGKDMQGYWQLFLFYLSYVGFFHLGWIDGIYLKLGGKHVDELDKDSLSKQFRVACMMLSLIALVISVYAFFNETNPLRQTIVYLMSVHIIISNLATYIGMIFQAVNEVRKYTNAIFIEKIVFLGFIGILLGIGNKDVVIFMIAMTVARILSLVYLVSQAKSFILKLSHKTVLPEIIDNIKIGMNLMLANIASTLIIGIIRFIVDAYWGTEVFGELSLSLSLINFFLVFISQASIVLFPSLRRNSHDEIKSMYYKMNYYLTIGIWAAFMIYPIIHSIFLNILPQYEASLRYLAILLPVAVFEGKVQLIYNTYFKVLRKERTLLGVNLIAVIVSTLLATMATFWIHSIDLAVYSVLLAIMIRSIIANVVIDKLLHLRTLQYVITDMILTVVFVFTMTHFSQWIGISLFIGGYILTIGVNSFVTKMRKQS